ncbi:MAG: DNA primase [Candidatus Andersenbacteria bacterium]|nr:DNA primase [Candidatus Andersenbacteria bacterium]
MSKETELIKERLDIASVVSEYVTLKQAGQNMKGLCPFHQEKTPSFIVSPGRGSWYCFGGCAEGGDIFSFVQKIEGLDFPATLKMLAERAGVQLPKRGSMASTNRRQRLFDVMTSASRFYQAILWQHPEGKKAVEYLLKRGLTEETMRTLGVGFAPIAWDVLRPALEKKGFTADEMVAVGLLGRSDTGKTYDRFRGRIMFPVEDTQGRVVAFGGRIVPWHETGNEGKYVNSPETELYEKRRVVYNLNRAKHALRGNKALPAGRQGCIVVEGYMDAAMLWQAGIQNVVASSGTAFTSEHIAQLARFTKTLHFCFDADAAGWKATVSATNAALAAGMNVQTIVLPVGKDPADVVVEEPEKEAEYFGRTQSLIAVLLDQFRSSSQLAGQEQQLSALVPLVKMVANPIAQGKMIQEMAESLHVPEQKIHQLLEAQEVSVFLQAATAPSAGEPRRPGQGEWQLLGILLEHPEVRAALWPKLAEGIFLEPNAHALAQTLHAMAGQEADFGALSASELITALPEKQAPFAQAVIAISQELLAVSSESPAKEAQNLLLGLQRRAISSRLALLQEQLAFADEAGRSDALRQFQVLTQELAAITHQT